jgi:hypothetical protein
MTWAKAWMEARYAAALVADDTEDEEDYDAVRYCRLNNNAPSILNALHRVKPPREITEILNNDSHIVDAAVAALQQTPHRYDVMMTEKKGGGGPYYYDYYDYDGFSSFEEYSYCMKALLESTPITTILNKGAVALLSRAISLRIPNVLARIIGLTSIIAIVNETWNLHAVTTGAIDEFHHQFPPGSTPARQLRLDVLRFVTHQSIDALIRWVPADRFNYEEEWKWAWAMVYDAFWSHGYARPIPSFCFLATGQIS